MLVAGTGFHVVPRRRPRVTPLYWCALVTPRRRPFLPLPLPLLRRCCRRCRNRRRRRRLYGRCV